MTDKQFSINLKVMMVKSGVSRKELAKNTGISMSTISKYRTGERFPTWVSLMKLKNALGCDVAELV
jgi:transcriptional regulator with XRE-family HTH domain